MTYQSEASEILRMFWVAVVALWPYVRATFLVWAILNVADSLSRIARNLERVVNRWDLEREANSAPAKAGAGEPEALV